eukprot:jgi/Tetstr1/432189/TSEL_021645.t1
MRTLSRGLAARFVGAVLLALAPSATAFCYHNPVLGRLTCVESGGSRGYASPNADDLVGRVSHACDSISATTCQITALDASNAQPGCPALLAGNSRCSAAKARSLFEATPGMCHRQRLLVGAKRGLRAL